MAIKDYSTEPDMNTSISGINIAEGCAPSGINNAIRQLMADVKAESEAQGQAVSDIDSALRALIAEEVAKCLKTSGDRMAVGAAIKFGSHDGIYDSKESGNTGIGINANSPSGRGATLALRDIDAGGSFALGARDASVANYLSGFTDGRLTWMGKNILTTAGDTLTGPLTGSLIATLLTSAGSLFFGGMNGLNENAPLLCLDGPTSGSPGRWYLLSSNGTQKSWLVGYPNGALELQGNRVLAGNDIQVIAPSTTSFTLPAGGTWRYICVRNSGDTNVAQVGTAAGGTTVAFGHEIPRVLAIRIS